MKSTDAQVATGQSQGVAKLLFIAGTTLVLGAGAAAFDATVNGHKSGLNYFASTQTQALPAREPLISYMPPAYDHWRRTDYVDPKSARRAFDRYSAAMRLPRHEGAHMADGDMQDAALAHFNGPNAQFVIFIKRIPVSEWAPPQGPVSIVGGKIFSNHALGQRNVVDISLERPDGLSVTVRGRGELTAVWPVLKNLGFWRV